MFEFQERRKLKKFLYSPIILIVLLIILILLLKAMWGVYLKSSYTKENLDRVNHDLAELRERERILSNEIEYLRTTGGKEEEIRERVGLVKPNEDIFIITNKDNEVEDVIYPIKQAWWQKILGWFKI